MPDLTISPQFAIGDYIWVLTRRREYEMYNREDEDYWKLLKVKVEGYAVRPKRLSYLTTGGSFEYGWTTLDEAADYVRKYCPFWSSHYKEIHITLEKGKEEYEKAREKNAENHRANPHNCLRNLPG